MGTKGNLLAVLFTAVLAFVVALIIHFKNKEWKSEGKYKLRTAMCLLFVALVVSNILSQVMMWIS
jgi:hypothetical protein